MQCNEDCLTSSNNTAFLSSAPRFHTTSSASSDDNSTLALFPTTSSSVSYIPAPIYTSSSASDPASSSPSNTISQSFPPDPTTTCDPHCHCATGNATVPTDGRWLCGWCAAVPTDPGHILHVTDVVLCKDNGCCNYKKLDGRCEDALYEAPPDFAKW